MVMIPRSIAPDAKSAPAILKAVWQRAASHSRNGTKALGLNENHEPPFSVMA